MTMEQRLAARARAKAWRENNLERYREYRLNNKERLAQLSSKYNKKRRSDPAWVAANKQRHKEYNAAHREHRNGYMQSYYASHKEERRAYEKAHRQKNRAEKLLYARQYYAAHKAQSQKYHANRYAENKAEIKVQRAAYYKRHPERWSIAGAKRRALKVAATVNLAGIKAFVAAVKAKAFVRCYYCERRTPTTAIHFDHIVALSKGGAHSVENLCVACAHCNLSKHNKPLSEWLKTSVAQQLLPL